MTLHLVDGEWVPADRFETVTARPVIVHGDVEAGFFYPLKNYNCPPANTGFGGAVIARMLRGQKIKVTWRLHYTSTVPQIVLCRPCKLGCFARCEARDLQIQCVHGAWSNKPTTTVKAAQRIGAEVQSCNVCGRSFSGKPAEWWSYGQDPTPKQRFFDNLVLCGKRCRERVDGWSRRC
jgi:hypothetical protein